MALRGRVLQIVHYGTVLTILSVLVMGGFLTLLKLGGHPQIALLASRLLGLPFDFAMCRKVTFVDGSFSKRRYLLAYGGTCAVSGMALETLGGAFGDVHLVGMASIVLGQGLHLLAMRKVVVRASYPSIDLDAFTPYPIHWHDSPEWVLFIKDMIRDTVLSLGHRLVELPLLCSLWRVLFGLKLESSILRAGMLFVHIPKAAGTSVSALLYGRNLPHLPMISLRRRLHPDVTALPSFAIVRDPVDRFLSAYHFTLMGGTELMLTSRFERWRLGRMMPLDRFLDTLEASPKLLYTVKQFIPQVDFVLDATGELAVDRLFAIGRDGQLPASLWTWLEVDKLPRLNSTPQAMPRLSAATRERIIRLYRADVELYERVLRSGSYLTAGSGSDYRAEVA